MDRQAAGGDVKEQRKERAHLVAVVLVAVGAGDEDGPPGPNGAIVPLPGRRALRRQPDRGLQPWGAGVRHGEQEEEQQRERKETGGRHGRHGWWLGFGYSGGSETRLLFIVRRRRRRR